MEKKKIKLILKLFQNFFFLKKNITLLYYLNEYKYLEKKVIFIFSYYY